MALRLLLIVSTLVTTAQADDGFTLRVLSYNIRHCRGMDGQVDIERIAGVIRSVEPDVVALQEVDRDVARSGAADQPRELGRLLGMEAIFGANIELQGGHYGNAILSRLPITRHQNHTLPNLDEGEQRGLLEAEIRRPDRSGTFLLFCTHFDHRRDDQERYQSAGMVNRLASRRADVPALLVGDLNDLPESRSVAVLEPDWVRANRQPLATIPVDRPARQIDYIFYRPAERWRVTEVRVLDEPMASDHLPLFAELQWVPPSG